MAYTLEDFARTCHTILTEDPGPKGRQKVCALVQELCKDEAFLRKYVDPEQHERRLLFEDPDLGFCIFAHHFEGARASNPHDHGPSWAIYGQARGETIMTDFALVEPASEGKRGKVRSVRSYTLMPGMAHLYNEGDLHAPRREGTTKLIRIEGRNMDKVRRFGYELVQ